MADILIIGSGIAGLRSALLLAEHREICLITKKSISESNTNYAQGGIASVLDVGDSFESHVEDTLQAGAGLCHPDVVRRVVEAGPRLIADLQACGIRFSGGGAAGRFALGREGGHSHRRIVHAGDFTGREMERSLVERVREHPRIEIREEHFAVDLACEEGRVVGVWVLSPEAEVPIAMPARALLLASGGSGKVYRYTSNPDIATGDGLAMAYRAGATVANLEFFQFHPTCLFHPDAKNFLVSEAVRGEGAVLRNLDGEAFLSKYDARAELAPRDVVARAIDAEMKSRGDDHVLLDTTVIEAGQFRARFPNIYERCLGHGLDATKEALPVVPAAHYQCGGVLVDGDGASDLEGLYVIGEAACTGLHGANRLASNSLLEAVFFAHEASARILADLPRLEPRSIPSLPRFGESPMPRTALRHDWESARRTMWDYVGIVRDAERLTIAHERMHVMRVECERWLSHHRPDVDALELRNVTLLGELQALCALAREESRGLHTRADFPRRDDVNWGGDSHLRIGEAPRLSPWRADAAQEGKR
jgi:L-aspartate oxidase